MIFLRGFAFWLLVNDFILSYPEIFGSTFTSYHISLKPRNKLKHVVRHIDQRSPNSANFCRPAGPTVSDFVGPTEKLSARNIKDEIMISSLYYVRILFLYIVMTFLINAKNLPGLELN